VEIVAALLRTLWQNLERSGARTSDQLASLALLYLEDGNAARRIAAMRQLILDDRYRDLVVHEVVRTADAELAGQIAATAARELSPDDAMGVLRTLQSVDGVSLLGPFVVLGSRDPGLLLDAYERTLADGVRPSL